MSTEIEKHDLVHEFPEYKDTIHDLKVSDNHFRKLFDEYHEVDHEVRRVELDIQPESDDYLTTLKKKRLSLKDQLHVMLKGANN